MITNLTDFIYASNSVSNSADLVSIFLRFLNGYGIDRFMMGNLLHGETSEKEDKISISTYPDEWMNHYLSNHYVDHDPVYRNALQARSPFTWDEIVRRDNITRAAVKVMGEASEFQLCNGIGISVYQPAGEIIGLGLSSPEKCISFDNNIMSILNAASIQFYIAFSELVNIDIPVSSQIHLTAREREVLHWIAIGKSKQEIAEILSVSLSCVKRHCENTFLKLGVNNLPSAVARSLRMGLINPF